MRLRFRRRNPESTKTWACFRSIGSNGLFRELDTTRVFYSGVVYFFSFMFVLMLPCKQIGILWCPLHSFRSALTVSNGWLGHVPEGHPCRTVTVSYESWPCVLLRRLKICAPQKPSISPPQNGQNILEVVFRNPPNISISWFLTPSVHLKPITEWIRTGGAILQSNASFLGVFGAFFEPLGLSPLCDPALRTILTTLLTTLLRIFRTEQRMSLTYSRKTWGSTYIWLW